MIYKTDKIIIEVSRAHLQRKCYTGGRPKRFEPNEKEERCKHCQMTDKDLVACHFNFVTEFNIIENEQNIRSRSRKNKS